MGGAGYIIAFMSHRALQAKESKGRCVSRRAGLQHSALPGGKASSEAGKGQHDPLGRRRALVAFWSGKVLLMFWVSASFAVKNQTSALHRGWANTIQQVPVCFDV